MTDTLTKCAQVTAALMDAVASGRKPMNPEIAKDVRDVVTGMLRRNEALKASRSKLLDAASEYRAAIVAIGTGGAFSEKTARVVEARNALDALIEEMRD